MIDPQESVETRAEKFLEFARLVKPQCGTPQEFWNAVFGAGAEFGKHFTTVSDRTQALKSRPVLLVQAMVDEFRKQYAVGRNGAGEYSGKFNVRLPKSLHEALVLEAAEEGVTLNSLVIAKLCVQLKASARL